MSDEPSVEEQTDPLKGLEQLLEKANKRVAEMAEMLNNMKAEGDLRVEDELDACVRKVQFLLDVAEGKEEGSERASGDRIDAIRHVVHCLEARKNPTVKMVDEMAHGTMLGEFVEAHVKRAVEQCEAKFKAPPDSRPDDGREQNPGWHGMSFIAEANMATGDGLTNDAAQLDAQADVGYYDDTCGSGDVLRAMAAWLRKMAARGK